MKYQRVFRAALTLALITLASCVTTDYREEVPFSNTENLTRSSVWMKSYKKQLKQADKRAKRELKNLSLDEKISQLFIIDVSLNLKIPPKTAVTLENTSGGKLLTTLDNTTKNTLNAYPPGGYVLFADNLQTEKQLRKLNESLSQIGHIKPFISIDEEGGTVSRLSTIPTLKSHALPSMEELAQRDNYYQVYSQFNALAGTLRDVGVNMDFAPVADLAGSSVIGSRAFGTDSQLVAEYVAAAVMGLQDGNIISVVKHFPGHGQAQIDPHLALPTINISLKDLEKNEFIPFKKAISDADVAGIMSAHIVNEAIKNTDDLPATLTNYYFDILRKRWGFDGLIITDALRMGAIANAWGGEEASLMSFLAGSDILLLPVNYLATHALFVQKYHEGVISKKRLDASVRRILRAKYMYGIENDD